MGLNGFPLHLGQYERRSPASILFVPVVNKRKENLRRMVPRLPDGDTMLSGSQQILYICISRKLTRINITEIKTLSDKVN